MVEEEDRHMRPGQDNTFTLTDHAVIRMLWLLVAVGVPIFGVSFWHMKLGALHLAPSVLFMLLILYCILLRFFSGYPIIAAGVSIGAYRTLAGLLAAFFLLHLLSLTQSALSQSDWLTVFGIKNMVKLFFGMVIFWLTLTAFPRDARFLERFFLLAGASLAVMLAVFIYRYAVVFHLPSMGTEYAVSSTNGRNQIAVQAAFFFLYLFSYFLIAKHRWRILPFLLAIVAALLYLSSRMAWAASVLGVCYVVGYVWRCNKAAGMALLLKAVLVISLLGSVGLTFIAKRVGLDNIATRILSIYNPKAIPEYQAHLGKNSYQVRGETIRLAMNGFLASPMIGVGVGNTLKYVERITHNDFATILVEMGIVGEVLFLAILWSVWRRGRSPTRMPPRDIQWLSLGARAGYVGLFICLNFFNFYLSPYFWFYVALYIVTVETTDRGLRPQTA